MRSAGEHHEFVAAQARGEVAAAQRALQPATDGDQETVAGIVAVLIVDGLELIQVDEGHDQGLIAAFESGDTMVHFIDQGAAIGQPCRGVGECADGQCIVGLAQRLHQTFAFDLLGDQARKHLQYLFGPVGKWFAFVAGGAQRAIERAVVRAYCRAGVGGNAQCARGGGVCPALRHVVGVGTAFFQRAFAQRAFPRHRQPLGNQQALGVACEQDVLEAGIGIDGGEVSGFQAGDRLQQLQ